MKKIILLLLVAVALTNCKKDNNNNSNNNSGIVIKGKISGQKNSGDSPSLADAKKVIVFSKYHYELADIVDGAFSVNAKMGTGTALIFLDANNKYIGNLCTQGLNILPLGSLENGENTTIDLSSLTMTGTSVIPSHNPLGNEIDITEKEINSLKVIDGYFKSLAKNIDTDNDQIPDVMANKQMVLCTQFVINGGRWGFNESPPVISDMAHYYVNYGIEVGGGSALTFANGNARLSGPVGTPYNDIVTWGTMMAPQCGADRGFIASFSRLGTAPPDAPWGTAFLPFKAGTYTLTLDDSRSYTLDYACIDVKYSLVIVVPTIHTNSEGKLTSISFQYKLPDGTVINPASMLTNVMIQLFDKSAHQFYINNVKLTTETGFTVLTPDAPVDISTLYGMGIEYDDLLVNHYSIQWR